MASSLADTLAARSGRPALVCGIGTYLAALDDDARADVLGAIRDKRVSSNVLAEWFTAQGVDLSDNTVRVHRQNRCSGCRQAGYDHRMLP